MCYTALEVIIWEASGRKQFVALDCCERFITIFFLVWEKETVGEDSQGS